MLLNTFVKSVLNESTKGTYALTHLKHEGKTPIDVLDIDVRGAEKLAMSIPALSNAVSIVGMGAAGVAFLLNNGRVLKIYTTRNPGTEHEVARYSAIKHAQTVGRISRHAPLIYSMGLTRTPSRYGSYDTRDIDVHHVEMQRVEPLTTLIRRWHDQRAARDALTSALFSMGSADVGSHDAFRKHVLDNLDKDVPIWRTRFPERIIDALIEAGWDYIEKHGHFNDLHIDNVGIDKNSDADDPSFVFFDA